MKDFEAKHDDEYIIMDVIYADIWWQMKSVSIAQHVRI